MVTEPVVAENDPCLTELTNEQSTGLAFIVVCSSLSFLAIAIVLGLYLSRVVTASRASEGSWIFLKTDIDAYFLSLLFSDMLLAVSGILNLKWVTEGRSSCGAFCSTQGGLEHIGTAAVALSTLAVALHTFFLIFFRWQAPRSRVIGLSVLIGMWTFLTILVLVPALALSADPNRPPFYTPSPAWCYIDVAHIGWAAGSSYGFAWFAALSSIVIYVLLFLRLRGILVGRWSFWRVRRHVLSCCHSPEGSNDRNSQGGFDLSGREINGESSEARSTTEREARKMLWYPLCYLVIILPISAVRWTSFGERESHPEEGNGVPFALMAAAASLFKLGGLADVLLFTLTRPNVLSLDVPHGEHNIYRNTKHWIQKRWKTGRSRFGGNNNDVGVSHGVSRERDELFEMDELRDTTSTTKLARRPGRDGSQVSLLQTTHSSALKTSEPREDRRQQNRLEIDLAEELPYHAIPVPPSLSDPDSSPSSVGVIRDRRRYRARSSLFAPLTLELPDPRISGMSFFTGSGSSRWIPLEREERLAFTDASPPATSSREKSIQMGIRTIWGTETQSTNGGDVVGASNGESIPGGSSSSQPVHHEPPSIHEEKDLDSLDTLSEARSGSPKREKLALGTQRMGIRKHEDPIEEYLLGEETVSGFSRQHVPSLPLVSRERRLRGPRPAPERRSSLSAERTGRPRPTRPTIGIPPSGSSTSFPSPKSSARSPRMRYPHSALAAIPEHHSLDQFPSRISPVLPTTAPLSLRAKLALTRPRSLSDGAQHEQQSPRPHFGRDVDEGGRERPKYASFIDMS